MKRAPARTASTVTLLATAALAVALAITAFAFTRAGAESTDIPMARAGLAHYSAQQRVALSHARQSHLHPLWRNLSWIQRVARMAKFVKRALSFGASAAAPAAANFQGNLTAISGPPAGAFALQRQTNCTLSMLTGTYTLSITSPALQVTSNTPNYEQVLHANAGLASKADAFPNGCKDPTLGLGSRRGMYLGSASGLYMFAASGYDDSAGNNALYYGTVNPGSFAVESFKTDLSSPGLNAIAAGDLNGDGLADIVGISATSAAISVWLAKADGSISSPVTYALTGNSTEAAVLADVNGDGKADVVVATVNSSGEETIFVLTGNGDGTLNAPQAYPVATPAHLDIANLIAADLRGTGHPDIVASNGVVLLNSGSGTFTAGAQAFSAAYATSDFGPNLAAADFNKDGKMDLAWSNGEYTAIYLGNGDGTFTAGKLYATPDTVGYITATDLDGDGNVDLYVGLGNGGFFGGDQFEISEGYALMGNGDGSFQGAPLEPFAYLGSNVADLTGNKATDVVALNADFSFTSYLNDGTGHFSAKATLSTTPITINGSPYSFSSGINSYALGDVNGDGMVDLVYLAANFYGPNNAPGVFVALGVGDGTFGAPTFIAVPQLSPAGSNSGDLSPTLSNLRLADVNGDGRADLIYGYYTQGSSLNYYAGTAVQVANADGTFQAPQTIVYYSGSNPTFLTSTVVATADFNHDNKTDLLFMTEGTTQNTTTGVYPYAVQVALGNGDGSFGAPANVTTADYLDSEAASIAAAVAVADMNGDGTPDIVALGSDVNGNMQVAIALGNGDGTFKTPSKAQFPAEYLRQSFTIADFNGDGKLDVATFGFLAAADSGISFGNGDGTLQTVNTSVGVEPAQSFFLSQIGSFQTGSSGAIAVDFNGDGKPDVLDGNILLLSQAVSTMTGTPSPSFALSAASASGSVSPGQDATAALTLTPQNGFSGDVTLACGGLPSGASCAFSPATVSVNGGPAGATLTIDTSASSTAQLLPGTHQNPVMPGGLLLAGMFAAIIPSARKWRGVRRLRSRWAALVMLGAALLAACGGGDSSGGSPPPTGSGTPAGTYSIVVTATSGSVSETLTYRLTVS